MAAMVPTRAGLVDVTNAVGNAVGNNNKGSNKRANEENKDEGLKKVMKREGSVTVPEREVLEEDIVLPSDPQGCEDYCDDIYNHLWKRQECQRLRAQTDFLCGQEQITSRMRGILLDWLVEVHYKFKLNAETLYLCINLIDRFLTVNKSVERKRLQLVGGTCMLIASKYEEFRPPEVGDIGYIMDNAYTRDEILEMEVLILNSLKFEVTVPSSLQFLEHFVRKVGISREEDHFYLAQYLMEATLLEPKFLQYKQSEIAACCLYLANRIKKHNTGEGYWPTILRQLTRYEENFVKPIAKEIFETLPSLKSKSLYKKYSMDKYKAVAPTVPSQ